MEKRGRQGGERPAPGTGPGGALFGSRRSFLGICLRYVALVAILITATLLGPVERGLLLPFREAFASAVSAVLRLFGEATVASGEKILGPGLSVRLVNECTGLEAMILLGAAVAVFPVSWRARGVGLALALAVMASVNFVRVISLSWISTLSDGLFQLAHLYLWPTLVMVSGLATLLFWVQRFALVRR